MSNRWSKRASVLILKKMVKFDGTCLYCSYVRANLNRVFVIFVFWLETFVPLQVIAFKKSLEIIAYAGHIPGCILYPTFMQLVLFYHPFHHQEQLI